MEKVIVYTNFKDGVAMYGVEETVKNYIILSEDSSGILILLTEINI